MKHGIKLLFFLLVLVMSVCRVNAETLLVSLTGENRAYFPGLIERVERALESTGYSFEVIELPPKRALKMLINGEIAMEMGRGPDKRLQHPDLIQIQPGIAKLTMTMVTSINAPANCKLSEEDFADMSVSGVLGATMYEKYYFPKFARTLAVQDYVQMFNLVVLQRADVSFAAMESLRFIPPEIKERLVICGTHLVEINIHSYLHKNFSWAKDAIEAAYRLEFGPAQ